MTPSTIAEFLDWLRPGGSVALTSIVPDGKTATATFSDYTAAERWALEQNDAGRNVYFTPQPTRAPHRPRYPLPIGSSETLSAPCPKARPEPRCCGRR